MQQINRKWKEEDEYLSFVDEYTNFICVIKKPYELNQGCVYVEIPKDNILHQSSFSDPIFKNICKVNESSIFNLNQVIDRFNTFYFYISNNDGYQGINYVKNEGIIVAKKLFELSKELKEAEAVRKKMSKANDNT